jgi:two-component system sensor histidine kinase/response regulator
MNRVNTKSILIIDDDRPMLLGLKTLLERNHYKVIVCEDSPSSLKLAEESQPALIMCDIMMPHMDGFKTREAILANPLTANIPFLFLSARNSQVDKLEGFANGADDYITKPFDPLELVARVDAIFRSQDRDQQVVIQEMSRQIEHIKAKISSNISPDLYTPMNQVLMSLEMMLRDKYSDPEKLRGFVETTISQSHRLDTLVNDLLFLTAYEKNTVLYLRQMIDIQNDFMLPISLRQDLYSEKNLTVKIQVAEGIIIHAPRREFSQVIGNLVDNAMKFAPPKTSVLIDLAANGEGGCILTVVDHGPSIPVELHEKVFERNYQINQDDPYGGLGIGLTVARPISRSLGGDVVILPSTHDCTVQMILPPAPLDMP